MDKITLKRWLGSQDTAISGRGFWHQILFVRDELPKIMTPPNSYDAYQSISDGIMVIGTHTSGDVKLPVFEINHPCGLKLVLRYNFSDWKISLESPESISIDFGDLFNRSEKHTQGYCEGFPRERVYRSFSENSRQFTVELPNEFAVWTFVWLIGAALNLRVPKTK